MNFNPDVTSEEEQASYRERAFVGVGRGEPITAAIQSAYEEAWEQAKQANDGPPARPLRLSQIHVWGNNPPNWCRVVLVDDGA